ncbi:MAG TPA: GNAT family N-acetyltransferase [Solirubrobacterales bacterium]|nr:GNAT family N-acetyltransferase [Solirubrobacterales bacterium]
MSLTATVIDDEAGLEEIRPAWDALAITTGEPYCAPGWMLSWWRHARPNGAALRVVVVSDESQIVGLAPLWTSRPGRRSSAYGFLTDKFSPPVGPLATPGCEDEVAEAIARALATVTPVPIRIALWTRTPPSGIAGAFARSWPGHRSWVHAQAPTPIPIVPLDGLDYDAWFATRSSKFRQESRRMRRRIEDEGAEFQLVGRSGIARAVNAFVRLHGDRWQGASGALVPGLPQMLEAAADDLHEDGRLRIFTITVEDAVIAVNVIVAAGRTASGWNSGFDPDWARFSPSMLLTLHAIGDAAERGDARFSLGPGEGGYKRRLTDSQEEWMKVTTLARRGAYPVRRLAIEGGERARALKRALARAVRRR